MLTKPMIIMLFALLGSDSPARAQHLSDCATDPIQCSILTPLTYAHFSQQAPEALSKIDLKDCKSRTWQHAITIAETLVIIARESANGYAAYKEKYPASYQTNLNARKLGTTMRDAWDMSAAVKVEMADKALQSGCVDIAEEGYRYVLARYTAAEQQGYQRRATAGLEDVRLKRGTAMCSWFGRC